MRKRMIEIASVRSGRKIHSVSFRRNGKLVHIAASAINSMLNSLNTPRAQLLGETRALFPPNERPPRYEQHARSVFLKMPFRHRWAPCSSSLQRLYLNLCTI